MKTKWFLAAINLKRTVNLALALVALAVGPACHPEQDKEIRQIIPVLEQLKPNHNLKKYKTVLIIPSAGCEGCISAVEKFVLQNIDSLDSTLIVFTRIPAKKIFKLKFRPLLDRPNVIVDFDNVLMNNGFTSIYPVRITGANDTEKQIEYLSP